MSSRAADPAAVLADALDAQRADEQQRALRALLSSPLLTVEHPSFALVRKHQAPLRDWLDKQTGWSLRVDPEVARLVKVPADLADPTRPARARAGEPFTRRRYVLLCLALAALERADAQITLGRLADAVVTGAADPELAAAGITFSLDSKTERGDLVAVVRLLLQYGALSRVAGDEAEFVTGPGDALYDIQRRTLAGLLATRRGPSTVTEPGLDDRLAAITEEFVADTDDARNRALRHRLTRRLLDDPVVYDDELDDDERAYLSGQRGALLRRIREATGLEPEARAEGVALLDPTGTATDMTMPEEGTDGHLTLLLAEHLAAASAPVSFDALVERTGELVAEHAAHWRRDVQAPGADRALTERAVARLEALRLVRRTADSVAALPALARYAVREPEEGRLL